MRERELQPKLSPSSLPSHPSARYWVNVLRTAKANIFFLVLSLTHSGTNLCMYHQLLRISKLLLELGSCTQGRHPARAVIIPGTHVRGGAPVCCCWLQGGAQQPPVDLHNGQTAASGPAVLPVMNFGMSWLVVCWPVAKQPPHLCLIRGHLVIYRLKAFRIVSTPQVFRQMDVVLEK